MISIQLFSGLISLYILTSQLVVFVIVTANGLNKNLQDISKYFFYFKILCKFLSK